MSGFGFRPNPQQGQGQQASRSDLSPQKDAWGNPLPEDRNQQRQPVNNDDKGKNQNSQIQNDDGIDDDLIDNIWEDQKSGTDDNNRNNNQQPQNNQQQQQQVDPKKQVDDYLVSVGLEPIVLNDNEKEELKNGNFDVLTTKMNEKLRNAHLKAMSGSKTMIDAAVKDAIKEAMAGADSTFQGRMNLQSMHEKLPFTKDKTIGPVAQTVMQRFLNRGASTEQAIEGVRKFFEKTSDAYTNSQVNKNRNGNYSGSQRNSAGVEAPEGGWLNILRGRGN